MRSNDAMKEAIGPNIKQVADKVGLSKETLYKYCNESNPLQRLLDLAVATGDTGMVELLAAASGGYFVKNVESSQHCSYEVAAALLCSFGKCMQEMSVSLADGKITPDEFLEMQLKWNDVQAIIAVFFRDIKAGKYDNGEV